MTRPVLDTRRFSVLPQSFFARVLAGALAASIPLLIVLAALLTWQSSNGLTNESQKAARNLASGAALRFQTWMHGRQDELSLLATELTGRPDPTSIAGVLKDTPELKDDYDQVLVVAADGRVLVSVAPVTVQPSTQPWFQQSLKQPVVSYLSKVGSDVYWVTTQPFAASGGAPGGVVVGDLKLDKINEILDGFAFGGPTEMHLLSADHRVIYSSDWGTITGDKELLAKGALTLIESNPAADRSIAGQTGATRVTDYRGKDVIAGYAPVADVGMALVASELASTALAPITTLAWISVLVAAAAIGIMIVVASLLARALTRPVAELAAAAAEVEAGSLSTRVKPAGAKETRELAVQFNAMVEQLQQLVVGLRQVSSQAAASATRLSSAAEELAASTAEQTSAATETSASMEELARTSTSIAETLERVAVQVQETRENLEQAQTDIQASGGRTLALAERINDINQILSLINEIADQTNLLALNAAIEAARAGESGRGFAVVADEVRRLAERSKTSAGSIAKIIESAQTESNATVMAMEQSSKQMEKGLGLLEEVVDASGHVQLITQQQRTATEQVVEAMEQITVGSRQISTTAHEISTAAAGHATLASELEKMSEDGAKREAGK